jgi:hypothetical protein
VRAASVRRTRRTKAEMAELHDELYGIAEDNHPCSVRQVYYVGIGRDLWQKTQPPLTRWESERRVSLRRPHGATRCGGGGVGCAGPTSSSRKEFLRRARFAVLSDPKLAQSSFQNSELAWRQAVFGGAPASAVLGDPAGRGAAVAPSDQDERKPPSSAPDCVGRRSPGAKPREAPHVHGEP